MGTSTEDDYKIAYEYQMRRNGYLQKRVENLQAELRQQKRDFSRMIDSISFHGLTHDEAKFVRSWLIEFEVEMGWLLDPTGYEYGIRNLALGYTADGEEKLDLNDENNKSIYEAAMHLDRLRVFFDLD